MELHRQGTLLEYLNAMPNAYPIGLMVADQEGCKRYFRGANLEKNVVYLTEHRVPAKGDTHAYDPCGWEVFFISVPGTSWEEFREYRIREAMREEYKEIGEKCPALMLEENQPIRY